jgi:hypothetical protein
MECAGGGGRATAQEDLNRQYSLASTILFIVSDVGTS